MKTFRMGVVFICLTVMLSGCTIPIPITVTQTLTLISEVTVPPNDLGLLESGRFEINDEFCELPSLDDLREMAREHIAGFLAERLEPRSIEITRLSFIATQGNFNSINRVEAILWADGEELIDVSAQAPAEGFGTQADLEPNVNPDLAEIIRNDISCLQYYAHMRGTLPEESLVFKVEAELKLRFGLRMF